jgi:hypothetical protein
MGLTTTCNQYIRMNCLIFPYTSGKPKFYTFEILVANFLFTNVMYTYVYNVYVYNVYVHR